jgi:hypothetical protein
MANYLLDHPKGDQSEILNWMFQSYMTSNKQRPSECNIVVYDIFKGKAVKLDKLEEAMLKKPTDSTCLEQVLTGRPAYSNTRVIWIDHHGPLNNVIRNALINTYNTDSKFLGSFVTEDDFQVCYSAALAIGTAILQD